MIIYLSHQDRQEAATLRERLLDLPGVTRVWTNHDLLNETDPDTRADIRRQRIRESAEFVFVDAPGSPQLIRNIELGFAIGIEVPVVFIGHPHNAYHRFGDVFSDADTFFDVWKSRPAA